MAQVLEMRTNVNIAIDFFWGQNLMRKMCSSTTAITSLQNGLGEKYPRCHWWGVNTSGEYTGQGSTVLHFWGSGSLTIELSNGSVQKKSLIFGF